MIPWRKQLEQAKKRPRAAESRQWCEQQLRLTPKMRWDQLADLINEAPLGQAELQWLAKFWNQRTNRDSWIDAQFGRWKHLSPWQQGLLRRIGVGPVPVAQNAWDKKLAQLRSEIARTGQIPKSGHFLRKWLGVRLSEITADLLPDARRDELLSIPEIRDFFESPPTTSWEEYFDRLVIFKKQFGHCSVPANWEDRNLTWWVTKQRADLRTGALSDERRVRLDELGFDFGGRKGALQKAWERMFSRAQAFYQEKRSWNPMPSDSSLAHWVQNQRDRFEEQQPERQTRLASIGIRPGARDELWIDFFQQLTDFKRRHGHCLVPINGKAGTALGEWLSRQRICFKKGKLPVKRQKLLEDLGVEWDARQAGVEARWQLFLAELASWEKEHGTARVTISTKTFLGSMADRIRSGSFPISAERRNWLRNKGFPV